MAFDRKNIPGAGVPERSEEKREEKDDLKEFIRNEENSNQLTEDAENEQKRKEAMTERD